MSTNFTTDPDHFYAGWESLLTEPEMGTSGQTQAEPVDMLRMREMVGDDPNSLRALGNLYLSEAEKTMAGLRTAVQAGSAAEVEALAHKLAGSSAMCGMTSIVGSLRELERSGKAGRRARNTELLLDAGHQWSLIRAYLTAHLPAAAGPEVHS
ncbi:MAG: Hpt domain-containing protein [Vicinamibacteria bacterium]